MERDLDGAITIGHYTDSWKYIPPSLTVLWVVPQGRMGVRTRTRTPSITFTITLTGVVGISDG